MKNIKTNVAMAAVQGFCRKVLDKLISFRSNESSLGNNQEARYRENMFAKFLSPFESYIVSIQSLLIWERPYISAVALLIVNIAYWVIVTCSRRLYSFVAVVSLLVFVYRVWVYQIWPEIRLPPPEGADTEGWTPIHPQVFSVPELSQHLNNWWLALCKWYETACRVRRTQPGLFCIVSCGTFCLLAIAGHVIPGVVLVYLLVMLMTFGPGLILYVVPTTWWPKADGQDQTTSSRGSVDQDSELDEFLPEAVVDDLTISEHLGGDSQSGSAIARDLGIEKMVLEATEHEESLSRGLGSFPNLEEEGSDEDEEPGVDLPALLVSAAASAILNSAASAATTPSSKASSNNGAATNNSGIHFVASHFKEGSSDSDNEEAFIEGLSFSRASESLVMESSMIRPLSMSSQRPLTSSAQPRPRSEPKSKEPRPPAAEALDSQTTPSSDLDISEYELVSESELSS